MSVERFSFAVYGSHTGEMDERSVEAAKSLGSEVAERGHTLITGSGKGLPYSAVEAAAAKGGEVVGYSPATSSEQHDEEGYPTEGFTEIRYVPQDYPLTGNKKARLHYRNISSAEAADAVICISGRVGTLNEFTNAYAFGKPIGLVQETGGVADEVVALLDGVLEEKAPFTAVSANPVEVIDQLEQHLSEDSNA